MAQTAARACQEEAAAETRPARAAAASLRCQGLLESDPAPLREAVVHYRTAGPAADLPAAAEDLAVVLAVRGQHDEARAALNEAISLYEGLNARWDIYRADGRLRPYGVRRVIRAPQEQRAVSASAALTPTEVKIAGSGRTEPRGLPEKPGGDRPPVVTVTEQLTDSETRVLRYLPTHLTMHDIASELFLSVNTVNTHRRHVYEKLGVHSRHEAVDCARALGLLAPLARRA